MEDENLKSKYDECFEDLIEVLIWDSNFGLSEKVQYLKRILETYNSGDKIKAYTMYETFMNRDDVQKEYHDWAKQDLL